MRPSGIERGNLVASIKGIVCAFSSVVLVAVNCNVGGQPNWSLAVMVFAGESQALVLYLRCINSRVLPLSMRF